MACQWPKAAPILEVPAKKFFGPDKMAGEVLQIVTVHFICLLRTILLLIQFQARDCVILSDYLNHACTC